MTQETFDRAVDGMEDIIDFVTSEEEAVDVMVALGIPRVIAMELVNNFFMTHTIH